MGWGRINPLKNFIDRSDKMGIEKINIKVQGMT